MVPWVIAWRAEILTLLTLAFSWIFFHYAWKRPFWKLCLPGILFGMALEFITEPEWTYSMQVYIWRDISPFVIIGWGILFAWLVTLSDRLYRKWFGVPAGSRGPRDFRLMLSDLTVGLPLFLSNELFGLHVLKVWQYNPILEWSTMLPLIHYPGEGLVAIVFFVLAVPNVVRYWEGK